MRTTSESLHGVSGVYAAIHRETGRCYVGSSVNLGARRNAHEGVARRGGMMMFHRSIRELGCDSFDFEVLERCAREHLLARERFYIVLLDAAGLNGFNVRETPCAVYGVIPSSATRERQAAAKRGKPLSLEHRKKLTGLRRKGVRKSKEQRTALSEIHKSSPKCIASLAKLHAARIGTKQSIEQIEKRVATLRGRKRSDETKAKISAILKGRKATDDHRARMSAGWIEWRRRKMAAQAQTLLAI